MDDLKSTPGYPVGKMDAARRQLKTAIRLWFRDADPVSIHTLAYAAYEIIHTVSKKRNPARDPLIFDSDLVKEEYRSRVNIRLKEHANFFKHGDRDGEAVIQFNPSLSQWFMFFCLLGLEFCGESLNDEEAAFRWWTAFHMPDILTEQGRDAMSKQFTPDGIAELRSLSKNEFFEAYLQAVARNRAAR